MGRLLERGQKKNPKRSSDLILFNISTQYAKSLIIVVKLLLCWWWDAMLFWLTCTYPWSSRWSLARPLLLLCNGITNFFTSSCSSSRYCSSAGASPAFNLGVPVLLSRWGRVASGIIITIVVQSEKTRPHLELQQQGSSGSMIMYVKS